jgi:hypothetical protein
MSLNSAAWNNAGTINLSSGTLNLGGSFALADIGTVNRSGGIVQISGSLNNTGTTLALNAATGSYRLDGGTITGGSITAADGSQLQLQGDFNSRLVDVAVGLGVLDFSATNARVRLQGTTTLAAGTTVNVSSTNSILTFEQTTTLNDLTVNLSNGNEATVEGNNNTLTLGPTTTINAGAGGG